jgi:hypothetical protein
MATVRGEESQRWLERQRARLLQQGQSGQAGAQASSATSEDGERRGKTAFLLRQNVWDAGADEGRKGEANPKGVVA